MIAGGVPRIYFADAFTAGKSQITISHNRITILHDGIIPKFAMVLRINDKSTLV
ncbi:MAG: hypothetical protein WA667_10675 [Candidatus Nitrosopolaris sp.]